MPPEIWYFKGLSGTKAMLQPSYQGQNIFGIDIERALTTKRPTMLG
ncbi:hypothetical protein PSPPH_0616 [Pseudomonas savastanoi pv. phaseolicola 1448A]|uniref:Uncharacterized protein n=3 Tax=Pseudomonas savastanoi TaxID=29438 RepID=A0A3M3FIP9_PSESG|nr:hypothetical protein PSPPH_0616 [Pseudomonas savastanoi pv. phaseolicola 1448A]KPB33946.1 Uncharacterized protein AC514_4148 [Pseudomonas savastanoi pv. phaseolicola]KPB65116.1 Uncharacterized protein AC508_2944 [Pseudomonas amygdali pv. mellea]RMM61777.1 hypothetical protein ALQ74_04618 [Pseudomonas savastanoi pv. glycinea]KPB49296.1 Uncharacterized protein AC513_1276 [Pseudomonas savastanoi pv. phaseolicola]